MTCGKCYKDWCWLCEGRIYSSNHFSSMNPFGCPDLQFEYLTFCRFVLAKLLFILLLPFFMLFIPVFMINKSCYYTGFKRGGYRKVRRCFELDSKALNCLIDTFIRAPVIIIFGLVGGVIFIALCWLPAFLLQSYRLLRKILKKLDPCRCLRCLPCFS